MNVNKYIEIVVLAAIVLSIVASVASAREQVVGYTPQPTPTPSNDPGCDQRWPNCDPDPVVGTPAPTPVYSPPVQTYIPYDKYSWVPSHTISFLDGLGHFMEGFVGEFN